MLDRIRGEKADRVDTRLVEPGPLHTKGLIGSVPSQNTRGHRLAQIPGMTPSLLKLPEGCAFKARCPIAVDRCNEMPALEEHRPGHWARCWRASV
jgi:peptide/nickel transport system ATP-binding protein